MSIFDERHHRHPEFYKQLTSYQKKGKNKHDDAPDVLAAIYERAVNPQKSTFRVRTAWGDILTSMFPVEIWGTVAAWVGSLSSGGALITAAAYYILDRKRAHRSQADRIVCWIHPNEHGKFALKVKNYSDQPVFELTLEIVAKPPKDIKKLYEANKDKPRFHAPAVAELEYANRFSLIDFHDRVEFPPDKQVEKIPDIEYHAYNYDAYAHFVDISGRRWRRNFRTGKFATHSDVRYILKLLGSMPGE